MHSTNKIVNHLKIASLMALNTFYLMPVHAVDYTITVHKISNTADAPKHILGYILDVCGLFGSVLMIWGILQLAMSMRSDDADTKHKALNVTMVGIILFSIVSVLAAANIIVDPNK